MTGAIRRESETSRRGKLLLRRQALVVCNFPVVARVSPPRTRAGHGGLGRRLGRRLRLLASRRGRETRVRGWESRRGASRAERPESRVGDGCFRGPPSPRARSRGGGFPRRRGFGGRAPGAAASRGGGRARLRRRPRGVVSRRRRRRRRRRGVARGDARRVGRVPRRVRAPREPRVGASGERARRGVR